MCQSPAHVTKSRVNNVVNPHINWGVRRKLHPCETVPKIGTTIRLVLGYPCVWTITYVLSFWFGETKPTPHLTKVQPVILTIDDKT
jgi:hypothetical protein